MSKIIHSKKILQWCAIVCIGLFLLEALLSAAQVYKWKGELQTYHISGLFRPLAKLFAKDDFYPRTQRMPALAWDYKTDRMVPGVYKQEDGLIYTINSYGLRGEDFQIPKPENEFRILVLGSSTAFGGLGIDDTHTYPALLQSKIAAMEIGKDVKVINYSFGSKSLYYNATHYFKYFNELKPDVVIINNIKNTWFYDQNQIISDYWDIPIPQRGILSKVNLVLTDQSLLWRMIRKRIKDAQENKGWVSFNTEKGVSKYNENFFAHEYYQLVEGILLHAQQHAVGIIFVQEPINYEPELQAQYDELSTDELFNILDKKEVVEEKERSIIFSQLLANSLKRLSKKYSSMVYLDPSVSFGDAQRSNKKVFMDHVHLTSQGSELMADLLAALIKDKFIK